MSGYPRLNILTDNVNKNYEEISPKISREIKNLQEYNETPTMTRVIQ